MILDQDVSLNLFTVGPGKKTPLTSPQQDGLAFEPSACANGRYIVFARWRPRRRDNGDYLAHGCGRRKSQTAQRRQIGSICGLLTRWEMGLLLGSFQWRKANQGAFGGRKAGKTLRVSSIRIRHLSRRQTGSSCNVSSPATPRNSWHCSQSILPRIRNFWTCNAQSSRRLSASPMMAKLSFIPSVTRMPITSGSSLLTVRRESRSPTSSRNTSPTFTGLSTAASWAGPRPHRFRCCAPGRVQTVRRAESSSPLERRRPRHSHPKEAKAEYSKLQ